MAKPKLALIPAAQGDKFYSVLPSDGVGDFTFTRGSSATRINAQGLIETVADTSSRLDYDLLNGKVVNCPHYLLEPQRSNLFTNSDDFLTSWSINQVEVDNNEIISPDGTLNADFISENTTINPHFIFQSVGTTTTSNYTISVFAKHNSRILQIFAGGGDVSGNPYANFDLENGVFNNNGCNDAFIENYGNGWFRCGVVVTSVVTSGFNPCFGLVNTLNSSRAVSYQGDGTSGIYIWGAMLEQSSYPTSYIPTTTTTITRAAETATDSGDAATFNDSEGVLMLEASALANDGVNRRISISNGSTSNRVVLGYTASSNQLIVLVSSNSVSGVASLVNIDNSLQFNKIALKYKLNDFALWINGIEVLTDNSLNSPIGLNDLSFEGADNLNDFYGKTRELQYFDSALTDAQLETLTSWTSLQEMITSQLYTNY